MSVSRHGVPRFFACPSPTASMAGLEMEAAEYYQWSPITGDPWRAPAAGVF